MMAVPVYLGMVLAVVPLLCIIASRLNAQPRDTREPVFIQPRVPFIGHAIGLFWHGGVYYTKLSANTALPIYTMPLMSSKFYVVNSLPLITSVSKASKRLSFTPFIKMVAERLSGLKEPSLGKFDESSGSKGIALDTVHSIKTAIQGKAGSAELDNAVLVQITSLLDNLSKQQGKPVNLLPWTRRTITLASSGAVYGPLNPLEDIETENALWIFQSNMGVLISNVGPKLLKRTAIRAREKVVSKYLSYYLAKGQDQGSSLARARHDVPARYGLNEEEIARLEVPFNFAILNNTVATVFWMLCHVYSQPDVLAELRREVQKALIPKAGSGDTKELLISVADLKTKCPGLLSAFHETLRVYSLRPNVRHVIEDTMLDNRYFLEKDSMVQLPTRSIHQDVSLWGTGAKTLNLKRFLDSPDGGNLSKSTAAFGSFGVAPHICPGRHFAATLIIAFMAQMILRFDIIPQARSGWRIPIQNLKAMNSVPGPRKGMEVKIVEREGCKGNWEYVLGEEGLKFALASG